MEQLRFKSYDRENRKITLSALDWNDPREYHFAKDLSFPQLDGIAPGDQVYVQFDVIEYLKGWREMRIVTIEKWKPYENSDFP